MKVHDLTGQQFERLYVTRRAGSNKQGQTTWHVVCECGTTKVVAGTSLLGRKAVSCGCLRREMLDRGNPTHGMSDAPEYEIWCGMVRRCTNPNNHAWPRYGGRGITVCDRWRESFETFLADVGPRPSDKHSIDRINNDGNYEPGNCRWATAREQVQNSSTYKGGFSNMSKAALVAEVRALRELRLYVRHRPNCKTFPGALCTCGLDAALKATEPGDG